MRMSDLPVPAERVCPNNELPETDFDPCIDRGWWTCGGCRSGGRRLRRRWADDMMRRSESCTHIRWSQSQGSTFSNDGPETGEVVG
jgi:hypothetical protein